MQPPAKLAAPFIHYYPSVCLSCF